MKKKRRKIYLTRFFFQSKKDLDRLLEQDREDAFDGPVYDRIDDCSLLAGFRMDHLVRSDCRQLGIKSKKHTAKHLVKTKTLFFSCRSLLEDALFVLRRARIITFRFNWSANEIQVRQEDLGKVRSILRKNRIKNTLTKRI